MEDVDRSEGGLSADHEQSTEETKLQGNEDMETSNNPTDNVKNDIQESGDLVNKENTNGDSAVEGNEVESEAKDEVKQVAGKEKDEKEDEDSNDEEDEEDVVVLDDIEDDGEDPGEVELEQFNQPVEHSVLADLSEMKSRRKVVLHPVKMSELNHPLLLEAIGKSIEFRTCYVQGLRDGHLGWAGYVEMNFKSTLTAAEAIQTLKTIREDLTVRCLEPGETAKNIIQSLGGGDSPESTRRLISGVLVVKAVAEEINLENLREVFVGSTDIVIPQNQKTSKRMAYVIYDGAESLEEAVKKFVNKQPEINGKPLRIYKYQPNAEMPAGLLRMKRRYRILLQMDMLKKAMKDKKANYSKNVKNLMSSTIQQCKSLIEKDDAIRKELGLSVFSLPELRRYKRIREAVKDDSIWLPGKKMHGPDRRGFLDDEDEEDKQKRYARLFASGDKSESGIPSLMSVTVDPKFTPPILRAQAMGQPVARMPPLGPPLGPPGPLPLPPLMPMRGGPGGPGPRGMMRGGPRGMMRGGPGAFRGGRGGFHDGPPPPPPPAPETFDFEPPPPAFRGRRGGFDRGGYGSERGFDRGGYGRGGDRGGYGRGGREGGGYGRGGDSGGYSRGGDEEGANRGDSRSHGRSDDGGYGRGGINKRPRSPVGGSSRNYRSQSQDKPDVSPHASKVPRKESDDSKESKWGPVRQDSSSRGGGRGGRGGYRQNQDSSNNWNRSTGPRDQSGGGYGKSGYSSSGAGTYGHHAPSGGHAENYSQPSTSAPPPSNSYSSSTQPSNIGSNMGGYGQQTAPPPAPNMSGYGQTGGAPPMTNYSQQPTSMGGYDQAAANAAAYNQAAASGYSQPGYSQPGYGQTNVTGYGQTQDTNTAAAYGYTQPTGADYYQAAANYQSGMVSYPLGQSYQAGATTAVPQQQAAAAANQGWGMMTPQQPAQQQQQQYWPTDQSQQATAWSTGTENAATTTPAVDPNAAYGYNWAAAGWKQ